MPMRRPSASVGPVGSTASASAPRVHKSTESHHVLGGMSTGSQQSSLAAGISSSAPQQKMIVQVLVNRLKNKLPCNSGVSLDRLEVDAATQQTIEALVDLSRDSLDVIAYALSDLLEKLAKRTDSTIEVLQSQLFVLKVLSMTMASRWSHNPRGSSQVGYRPPLSTPDSPIPPGKRPRQASSEQSSIVQAWSEPPPMEDNCAKYILSVMVVFMRQTQSTEVPLVLSSNMMDASYCHFDTSDIVQLSNTLDGTDISPTEPPVKPLPTEPILRAQASSNSVRSGKLSISSSMHIPATNTAYEKTHMSVVKSSLAVNRLIAQYAGRIIFHISASNWNVVFNRLRTKIRVIANNNGQDNPDIADLQLMAYSVLDRQRLVQLLNDLSSLLVNMEREAHLAIAVPLRAAIWNWIDLFPGEFNDAIRTRGRMESAPERVFDLLYSVKSSGGHERVFWPTLSVLNNITADRIPADFSMYQNGAPQKSSRKDLKFFEEVLRHSGTNSKLADVSIACATESCRAAMYITPGEEVPLRLLAYDVAHEIKTHLCSTATGRKPFWELPEDIDVALYADALVAVFRFLPYEDSLPLFATAVEPERSEAVKTCALRAVITLIQEAPRFHWQKSLDKLQNATAHRFREILRTTGIRRPEVDQFGNTKRIQSRPKAKRTVPDALSDREVLLLGILTLWRLSPVFLLKGVDQDHLETWVAVAAKLWEAPIDNSVKVAIAGCLRNMSEKAFNTPPSDPSQLPMTMLVKNALPVTLLCVSNNLLISRTDLESQRIWMAIAHQIVELYTKKPDFDHVAEIQCDAGRLPAFALSEVAFLVSLTSADINASQLAAKGLRLLSHAERQPGSPANTYLTDEELSKRNPIYEQLGDPRVMVVGRLGHQKRIRKLVRLISYSSGVHVAVWEECYWRWRSLTESIFEALNEIRDGTNGASSYPSATLQEQRFQWQNLTLFLAALGGSCMQETQDLTTLSKVIPAKFLPDKMRVMQNPIPLVNAFTAALLDLLVVPDLQMRDVARDAVGTELSPRLYGKLLKSLEETMREIEHKAGPDLTEEYLLLLDQVIAVLKLLVENAQVSVEDAMSFDVSSIMMTLASFIGRFTGPALYRIKLKYCVFCDCVCESPDTLMFRKDSGARHAILDIVLSWFQPDYDRNGDYALLCNELNMASLRTTVKLLDRLELRPHDGSNTGDDAVHVVSRLFNKYLSVLLQALEICQPETSVRDMSVFSWIDSNAAQASDSVSDLGSTHQKTRVSQREAEVRELVITGLSHLVIANSESGFKACLQHLAYDQDNRKRAIFAHVFARVISQGTKFDPEDRTATESRHARLCELVRGSEMVLAITICEICPPSEVEMMISVLLNIFNTRASVIGLLKLMIDREISQTENEAGLFRSNSTCTRFLSAFARIHGYNYLRELVQPLINIIEELPPGSAFEVDTNRVTESEAAANKETVEYVASRFLTIVSSSIQSVPAMVREICAHIAQSVVVLWPDSKFPAIGAFVFLRFISPAVVSPEIIDVELPRGDNTVIRRGLMVTAKILQNLANNIFFGKEAHMTVYNKFLQGNITNVTRFLSELHKHPAVNPDDEDDQWLGMTSDDTDMIVLHRFFDKHADKIGKELLSLSKPTSEGDASAVSGKRAWDGLCALLVDLGIPMEAPRLSPLNLSTHEEFLCLMDRFANRSLDSVQDFFVETDVPQDGPAVFVLCFSKIDVETVDIELLMYHILKTLSVVASSGRAFEIILDCTSFASMSELPLQWLKFCVELIPSDIRSQFTVTHILNPNTLAQKYMRRLYNVCAGATICGEIRAYTSIFQLVEHVPEEALIPLVSPVTLEQEPKDVFEDVKMKVPHMRLPITLEIASTHLRVTSVKKQPISPGLACRCTEIIPLADISDVYNVSTGHEPHEFIIRRRQGVTIYFSSVARETIVKTIRSAKGRLKEAQTQMTERFSRFSNVPATLLHIGLLSIDLNDEELRGAAYDLLGAVCVYLKYDKTPIIASKAGFIPGDSNSFVIQLSERLADFAPQLTLDFIHEVSAAMPSMGIGEAALAQRINCLQYMSPWIRNFAQFANPTSPLFERSGARLRDCIRTLSELSMQYPEVTSSIQKYVWSEVNNLDASVVDVILDELVRTAADGGIGTRRCEAIAHIVGSLSSINVRGRVYSKLRKALGKQATKVTNTLTEHPSWTEISSLIRLALVAGTHSRQPSNNQLYVPEIVHLVTLVAGEGPSLVRKSVYGIVMNLLQSLYMTRTEEAPSSRTDDVPSTEVLQLINECTQPQTLRLFGLLRETPTSDYTNIDPVNDKECLDLQEQLSKLLIQILGVTSGTRGLLNVWRARWMSLVTSTAFQLSPAVQTRSFSALGCLAVSDVDDDFVYQILVAFRTALTKADEAHTISIVSMLRCMCKVIPAVEENSKYICLFFWLAVALLQSSHSAFYIDSTCLLRVTLETMERQGMFKGDSVASILLDGRAALDDVATQLDELLRISFDASFSFSLAAIIFKGMRQSTLKASAEAVLRSLLGVTVRAQAANAHKITNGFKDTVPNDVLGYFLALLPVSTTPEAYRRLLRECDIDEAWFPDAGLPEVDIDDGGAPRVSPAFLGINDQKSALLSISFIGTILTTAQGDDPETEMLYTLLSEFTTSYPDIVAMTYENMQEKIKDTFANASNANIIRAVSNIFRVALQDNPRFSNHHRSSSSSTLNATDENATPPSRHGEALDEYSMLGLATPFQFLPPNRGHVTKMINWIPSLVSLMIL